MRHIAVAMSVSIIVCTEFGESCGTPSECDELGKEEEEDGGHGDGGWPGLRRAEVGWCKRSSREWEINRENLTYSVHTPLRHGEPSASNPGE